jgi:hypothetical protein
MVKTSLNRVKFAASRPETLEVHARLSNFNWVGGRDIVARVAITFDYPKGNMAPPECNGATEQPEGLARDFRTHPVRTEKTLDRFYPKPDNVLNRPEQNIGKVTRRIAPSAIGHARPAILFKLYDAIRVREHDMIDKIDQTNAGVVQEELGVSIRLRTAGKSALEHPKKDLLCARLRAPAKGSGLEGCHRKLQSSGKEFSRASLGGIVLSSR